MPLPVAARDAVERARAGDGPTLIEAKVTRLTAHSSDDQQTKYRSEEELAEYKAKYKREKKRERKAMEPAAKAFLEEMADFSIPDQFDTMFGSEPSLGMSPGQALGIQAEFLAIAEDQFYRANGDPEIAQSRAVGVPRVAKDGDRHRPGVPRGWMRVKWGRWHDQCYPADL